MNSPRPGITSSIRTRRRSRGDVLGTLGSVARTSRYPETYIFYFSSYETITEPTPTPLPPSHLGILWVSTMRSVRHPATILLTDGLTTQSFQNITGMRITQWTESGTTRTIELQR